jgi:hypothetical protein
LTFSSVQLAIKSLLESKRNHIIATFYKLEYPYLVLMSFGYCFGFVLNNWQIKTGGTKAKISDNKLKKI